MKVDFTKVQAYNIDGSVLDGDVCSKAIGNLVHTTAKNLDLVPDISMAIYNCEEVEMRESDLDEVLGLCMDPKGGLIAFLRKGVKEYIEDLKQVERERKAKERKAKQEAKQKEEEAKKKKDV